MILYLGIDGGGTHTRARLVAADGTVLGAGEAGPVNSPAGIPAAIRAIEEASFQAIAKAGLPPGCASSIRAGMGLAGLERPARLTALRAHSFRFYSVALASDAATANLGAHRGGDGAVVIVGTGSVGFARVGTETFTIGGYGFPVSDEGSGAELGLRAVRRALWARDGRVAHSAMTRAVLDHFHGSAAEIITWTAQATPADYGGFAPLVLTHAEAGDPVAGLILRQSALRLGRIIRALLAGRDIPCCLMGGLAPHIRRWLPAGLVARLREPLGDALDGALLLAQSGSVTAGESAPA